MGRSALLSPMCGEAAGPHLNIKTVFSSIDNPIIKIRRSLDRLIFVMGIPLPVFSLRRPFKSINFVTQKRNTAKHSYFLGRAPEQPLNMIFFPMKSDTFAETLMLSSTNSVVTDGTELTTLGFQGCPKHSRCYLIHSLDLGRVNDFEAS